MNDCIVIKRTNHLDHQILLENSAYYRLHGKSIHLFQSHLSNRKQFVEIDDNKST